jgi:hypothetical protein
VSDQLKKSQMQTLAAGFLGFVGVVGLGSLLILHHGGAAVKAPVIAYAPVDADTGAPAPLRAANRSLLGASLDSSGSAASSPAPLLPDEARDDAVAASGSAASVDVKMPATAAASKPAAKLVSQPLDSGASASSSAAMPVAAATKSKALPAKKTFVAPKLDLAKNQGIVASTVHYGVSDRAELMGRAAGPVYNFTGKTAGQAQSDQVANAGQAQTTQVAPAAVAQQVDAAKQQLDASDVPADQKAALDQNLSQARTAATAAPSGQ